MEKNKEIFSLRDNLNKILDVYLSITRVKPYGKIPEIWDPLNSIKKEIHENLLINFSTMHVKWSAGQGRWARAPWIAIYDERVTTTIQKGYFCAYSFNLDMRSVSLNIGQGINYIKEEFGNGNLRDILSERARKMRPAFTNLSEFGFKLDNHLDLGSEGSQDYTSGVVLYKTYFKNNLPVDGELSQDLNRLLVNYEEYIDSH